MFIQENQLYHIYNQGNNRQPIFYNRGNYLYFLQGFRKYVHPYCKVMAYCLMPNHFHFMIYSTNASVELKNVGNLKVQKIMEGFRILLSSYAQALNRQKDFSGSVFRQKTKSKLLTNDNDNYPIICFNYIHQNPLVAGLVNLMEDWEFSSFREYISKVNDSLCDITFARQLLDIPNIDFYNKSYEMINQQKSENFSKQSDRY